MNLYRYIIQVVPLGYCGNKEGINVNKEVYENVRETPKMVISEDGLRIHKDSLNYFIMTPTANIFPEVKVEFNTTNEKLAYEGLDTPITPDEYVRYKISDELDRVKKVIINKI